jgi:hypothetical protein
MSKEQPEHLIHYRPNPVQVNDADRSQVNSAVDGDEEEKETTSLAVVEKELGAVLDKPIDKNEFAKYLGLAMDKYDIEMDAETATKYKRHIMSLRHGMHAAVPLNCYGGKKCPIGSRCPFTKRDSDGLVDYDGSKYPLFKSCPIEQDMIRLHMMDLVDEYGIAPDDYTDLAIVSKLATLDVIEYRANMMLATDHEGVIISEVTSIEQKSGEKFISRRINPAFDIVEKIHRMRQDLVRSMVGTRREKYKKDAATGEKKATTDLVKNMHNLLEAIEAAKEENDIIEADYTVVEEDNA